MIKRPSMPSIKSIARWWTSEEGQKYIKQLEIKHDLSLDKLKDINDKGLHCWSCYKDVSCNERLERCHIIPNVHGGSSKPKNLILMCINCHKSSPTINDEYYLLKWLEQSEHHAYRFLEYIKEQVASLTNGLSDIEIENLNIDPKYTIKRIGACTVSGQFPSSTKQVIIRESIKDALSPKGERVL